MTELDLRARRAEIGRRLEDIDQELESLDAIRCKYGEAFWRRRRGLCREVQELNDEARALETELIGVNKQLKKLIRERELSSKIYSEDDYIQVALKGGFIHGTKL